MNIVSDSARQRPVYDHRPGDGPTLVFLHYWGGSARTWDPVVDCLPGRDVVTVDFRGWGRSRDLAGPYTLAQFADDVLGIVRAAEVEDYVLLGHSMGGKVAQLAAARHPVGLRGIVLVAPGPAKPPATVTPQYQDQLAHAYDSEESIAAARDTVLTATPLSEASKARVLADSSSSADGARREWPLHGIVQDITEQTRAISVPALVIGGRNDRVEPVEVLRDNLMPYLSDATLAVIPNTGHLSPLEAPVELADAVARFGPLAHRG